MSSNKTQTTHVAAAAIVTGTATLVTVAYLTRKRSKKNIEPSTVPTKPTIYGFQPIAPDADSAPACLKLATYLRICGVDFDHVYFEHGMKGSPKGKIPWIHWDRINSGRPMGDSTLIVNALMKFDPNTYDIDRHLTDEQRAIGLAFKTMLEESTYWTGVVNVRWLSDQVNEITVPTYFNNMPIPSLLKPFIINKIKGNVKQQALGQGTALLSEAERKEKFDMELKAISDYLGDNKYILGDKVSSFDATVFAWLAVLTQGTWKHAICDSVRECSNLMDYVQRIRNEFWAD